MNFIVHIVIIFNDGFFFVCSTGLFFFIAFFLSSIIASSLTLSEVIKFKLIVSLRASRVYKFVDKRLRKIIRPSR